MLQVRGHDDCRSGAGHLDRAGEQLGVAGEPGHQHGSADTQPTQIAAQRVKVDPDIAHVRVDQDDRARTHTCHALGS